MEHVAATHPWLVALEQSALGTAMRQSIVLYPTVEVLHILGFALLVGSIAAFDLCVLGVAGRIALPPVAKITVPLAALGLGIAAPAGLLLFTTEATHIAVNPAFQAKLACIALGLLNAAIFRLGPWRNLAAWGLPGGVVPPGARAGAVVSLIAWLGAITGGRLIAYV
jgi:hypothetical protein